MSNNRSTSGGSRAVQLTMDQVYIDFFNFLQKIVDPLLPEHIKTGEMYTTINKEVPAFLKTVKGFAYTNAVIGQICKPDTTQASIKNIISVTEDREKLNLSAVEIKTFAKTVAEYCNALVEIPDEQIIDKIEVFSLYVEMITKQFIKK